MQFPSDPSQRFEFRARLGAGSFGAVYEAFDHHRNRLVALKVLEQVSPDAVSRFKREFRYLAEVRHPNLASMHELLMLGDHWALSMELVQGSDLLEHLARVEIQHSFFDGETTLNVKRAARVSDIYVGQIRETFRQLATGISALHESGIVHRDVKPSNIMITGEGRVVLLDFGLVAAVSGDDTMDRQMVAGTPGYMSPEQITASATGPASDWYSFGVMLFQALTGQMPFGGLSAMEALESQVRGTAPQAQTLAPGVPADLASLAGDLLQSAAEKRPVAHEVLLRLGAEQPVIVERARTRNTKLVGRGRELRSLMKYVTSTRPDRPRLILMHGAAGVGKSALSDRMLDEVRAQGDTVILGGRCGAWESLPFNAVDGLVDSLVRVLRHEHNAPVQALLSRAVAAARLFPALGFGAGTLDDETIVIPRSGKQLTARAAVELRGLLVELAAGRPMLLALDDGQWGDFQSAEMFLKILRGVETQRFTLLVSYRTEDWRTSLLLQTLRNSDIPRHEVELRPLSSRMMKEARMSADSKGNPMLAEMIREVPSRSLRDAVLHRLGKVSAPARILFEMLIAEGRPVDEAEVRSRLELFEIDEPMRTLARDHLIRLRRTGNLSEIDVYHPRIREVLR